MVDTSAPRQLAFGRAPAKFGGNPALDGLRALAVAGVVGLHGGWAQQGAAQGVTVFFVISGYLITSLLIAEYTSTGDIRFGHFYRRRIARLAPALVVVVVVTAVWLLATGAPIAKWIGGAIGSVTYTTDLISAYAGNIGVNESYQWSWSLAIEEQFYLLWPLILFILLRVGRLLPGLALVVLGIIETWANRYLETQAHIPSVAFAFGPFTHTDALLLGCGIGLVLTCYPDSLLLRRTGQVLGPIGVVVLGFVIFDPDFDASIDPFGIAALAAGAIVWWVALDPLGWFGRLLGWAPLGFLGRLSYGIYLWNIVLLLIFQKILGVLPGQSWWAPVWLAAIIGVAWLSYRFVEQPLRRRWAPPHAHAVIAEPERRAHADAESTASSVQSSASND